jgi:hypothetical protein
MSDYGVSLVTKFGLGDVIRQPYCLLRQPRIPLELQDIACGWQAVEATSFDYYRELRESDGDLELTRSLSTGTGAGRFEHHCAIDPCNDKFRFLPVSPEQRRVECLWPVSTGQ